MFGTASRSLPIVLLKVSSARNTRSEPAGIVDGRRCFGQILRRQRQPMEVQIRQKSVADVAQIHPGARAEQPKPQRFRRHFQAEYARDNLVRHRNMFSDVHG